METKHLGLMWVDKISRRRFRASQQNDQNVNSNIISCYLLIYATIPIISVEFSTLLCWSLCFIRLNVSHWQAIFELVHSSRLFTTIHPCSLCTHSLIIIAAAATLVAVVVVRFGHFYLLYFISCLNSLNYLLSMPLILCIEQGCCAKYVCNF